MKIHSLVLFLFTLCTSCSTLQTPITKVGNCEGPFVDQKKINGVYTCHYPDGKLSGKFTYKNGKKNGVSEVYSESGPLQSTVEYKENWLDGTTRDFYPSGQLKVERHFKEGKNWGSYTEYWGNGKVKSSTTFENNHEVGPASYFDESGIDIPGPKSEAP